MVDRNAFDKIIQAGGYTTIRTGQAQDANAILIPKEDHTTLCCIPEDAMGKSHLLIKEDGVPTGRSERR